MEDLPDEDLTKQEPKLVLTKKQRRRLGAIRRIFESSIQEACDGCSAAQFAPGRIAGAVAVRRKLSAEGAVGIAKNYAACSGRAIGILATTSGEVLVFPIKGSVSEADRDQTVRSLVFLLNNGFMPMCRLPQHVPTVE